MNRNTNTLEAVLRSTWDNKGRMVMPACPPMTGTLTSSGFTPMASPTKALARTTSSLVTPNNFRGSYVPALRNNSRLLHDKNSRRLVPQNQLHMIPISPARQVFRQAGNYLDKQTFSGEEVGGGTLLEDLGCDGDSGVDWVRDDGNPCLRAVLGDAFTQRLDDPWPHSSTQVKNQELN